MKKRIYIPFIMIVTALAIIMLPSCESDLPNDYIPRVFVEGYLIVGEPITNIVVEMSQPVSDSFKYDQSLIDDAEVNISDSDNTYPLEFRNEGGDRYGYYYPDTTFLVKPNTTYKLEITLKDGTYITGETKTPEEFQWIKPPKKVIYYPQDTLNLLENDTLEMEWSNPLGYEWYFFIRVRCLDTLGYGEYLSPPVLNEFNRRIFKPFGGGSRYYNDRALWVGPLPASKVPFAWNFLKWYGFNEISVYLPEFNFLRWFLHVQRFPQYQPLLSSLEGAMGTFGSASVIYDTTFIMKNQP